MDDLYPIYWSAIALFIACGLSSCSLLSDARQDPRLVIGESIDGIKIGDSQARVVDVLGQPDSRLPGDIEGTRLLYFADSTDLAIEVSIQPTNNDRKSVFGVTAYRPYTGTTEGGIGINSRRHEARNDFGKPDTIKGRDDIYIFKKARFVLSYEDGKMIRISMSSPPPHR